MTGFIDDFLKDMDKPIPSIARTPAGKELLTVNNSEPVTEEQKEFFHSTVARLLYLGKKVRPEILVSISYLAKREQKPSMDDYKKMERVVKYLRGSRELGIVLSSTTILQVLAYIGASHSRHEDHKGHTICIISLGRGSIYAKSGSESELIGLSDSASQVIWMRNFLISQGYTVQPSAVYQDNTSCMSLVRNGKSNSERTRHTVTRFYFIKDRVDNNEIRLEYLDVC
jgi:histone deacetylase 1/2